jgi:hypothetical protein
MKVPIASQFEWSAEMMNDQTDLKSVVETCPVASFVCECAALVIGSLSNVGHRRVEKNDTVFLGCGFVV